MKRWTILAAFVCLLVPAAAMGQQMWLGGNLGVFIPTEDNFDVSIGIGGNFLYEFTEVLQIEGFLSYVFLNQDGGLDNFNGSIVPIAGGVRYEFQPGLHGDAGLGLYRTHTEFDTSFEFLGFGPFPFSVDETNTDLGLYFGGGYVVGLEKVDVDFLLRFHWPDLDEFLVGLSVGVIFPLGGGQPGVTQTSKARSKSTP